MVRPTKRAGCVDLPRCCCDQFQIVRRHPPSVQLLHQSTHTLHRTAVSESSYLPFLFHAEDKILPSFNGRRSFAKGKEVIPVCFTFSPYSALREHATNPRAHSTSSQQPEPAQSSGLPQPTVTKLEPDSVSGGAGAGRSQRHDTLIRPKREKKPVSISGFKSSPSVASSASRSPGKEPALPASSLIYQNADVGVDLGSARRAARDRAVFIKPADVDAPPRDSPPPRNTTVLSIAESAPVQAERKKRTIGGSGSSTRLAHDPEDSRKKRKR